jgi:hypothetical protein
MINKRDNNKIIFGCYIYQQGLEYKDIQRIVIECERLGFDSIWLKDNFTSSFSMAPNLGIKANILIQFYW